MNLLHTPGALKRFRKTAWPFQQTFGTPLQNLRPFVSTIVSSRKPLQTATIVIDQVVMTPGHLSALLTHHSLPTHFSHDWSITATGPQEIEALFQAALSDWTDFIFLPTPKPFAIYADHDQYTTIYAHTKSNLNHVIEPLTAAGFELIPNYQRQL